MKSISEDTKQLILKLQEIVGSSNKKASVLELINGKRAISEIITASGVSQATVSRTIIAAKAANLIKLKKKKGNSEVYERESKFKQINIKKWVKKELSSEKGTKKLEPNIQKVKRKIPTSIPFLDTSDVLDAEKMTEPFIHLYLFENSVRSYILKKMEEAHGKNWWGKVVTNKAILDKVGSRKKLEGLNKWHTPRGGHEIFYTDLTDLSYILNKEKTAFETELNVEHWIVTINVAVKLSRNVIDHHNPLPKREIDRLKTTLEDWRRQFQ